MSESSKRLSIVKTEFDRLFEHTGGLHHFREGMREMFRFRVRVAPIFGEVNSLLTTCNSRRIILYRGDVGVLRCSELLEGLLRRHLCCNYVPHGQADLQGLGRSDLPHCLLYWHCFLEHPEFTIAALRAFILLPGIFKHSSAC